VKEIKVDRKEDRSSVATHWQSEVQALEKMNELDKNHIVRFITAFRCGKENDYHHYLMFEWADGGNLINLWEKIKSPEKTPEFLQAVLKELLGLASVLAAAHYMEGNSSYRHGDLKPANILWFPGGRGKIGTLKIGDWGEAKIHFVNTEARRHNTSAKYATRRYEAPENGTGITLGPSLEVDPKAKKANDRRSRLYDIWGIGCIFLEMLVWLVYGFAGHEKFAGDIKDDADQVSPFYQVRKDARGKKYAEVHELVDAWMTALAKDPYCQVGTTALGDLLEVIRIGLLVVKLPEKGGTQEFSVSQESPPAMEVIPLANAPNIVISHEDHDTEDILSGMLVPDASKPEVMTHSIKNPGSDVPSRLADKGKGKGRIVDTELKKRLECITCHKEDSYWQPDRSVESDEQALHAKTYPSLVIRPRENGAPRLKVVGPIPPNYEHPPLDPDDWIYKLDNLFATSLFEHLQSSKEPLMPQSVSIDPLCKRCEEFRDFLWQPSSYFKIEKSDLSARAQSNKCSLCRLLWKVCSSSSSSSQESDRLPESLLFRRIDAGLCINDSRLPALSTFRGPRMLTLHS
jgi:serine/threonine protein kinase